MNEQHVFSCMDSTFMHTLPKKIDHVRRLRVADFQDDQKDHEAAGDRDDHPQPQQKAPPPLLLEDVPRYPSPELDAMDVDRDESEGEYEEPEDDDDDKEAPSEQDTDEASSRRDNAHVDRQSDECESIRTQSPQPQSAASPMRGRVLEFEEDEHVTSLAEGEPAEDQYRGEDHEGDANEEQGAEDSDHEEEFEGTLEGELEGEIEGGPDDAQEGACEGVQEELEVAQGEDDQARVEEEAEGDAAELTPEVGTTSRPSTASLVSESEEELPPPSAPKSKASKRGKHKDRHTKRHSSHVPEPVIAESVLEDKIVGILRSTLPNLLQGTLPNMLSGLLQEALGLAKITPPQQVPTPTPTVDIAVSAAEPERVNDQVGASLPVGVQAMDVSRVDAAPTTMDTDKADVTVSIRSP
jgi:hypothetical protein